MVRHNSIRSPVYVAYTNMSTREQIYAKYLKMSARDQESLIERSHGLIRPIGTLGKPNKRDRAEALTQHELIMRDMGMKV